MIDLNKTYRTRSGCPVHLWTTSARCKYGYTVYGEVYDKGSMKWFLSSWTIEGLYDKSYENGFYDLVEYSPPKLRPYNDSELWELRGRCIQHKNSPDGGSMITGIDRGFVNVGGMTCSSGVLIDFVFCKGDPEEGKPVAKAE